MKPTYFTCTLGQAASLNLTDKTFTNIGQFLVSRAESSPDQPAVGFARPSSTSGQKWESTIWTFSEVLEGSKSVAELLLRSHGDAIRGQKTVALICPSTPEFLFTWLALMLQGHAVLLIAPQCQPAAIAHLCKACDTTVLLYDDIYASQSQESARLAVEDGLQLNALALPFSEPGQLASTLKEKASHDLCNVNIVETNVAYFHHTSGTSSGLPKPIPQTHRAGAGVLPAFSDGKDYATFTTTPLYHGGIADLFRAWASSALIWLFPGKGLPITANNILKCLDAAAQETEHHRRPPVKYFSSVPYVLQMLEADPRGLEYLQNMHIVGVGGAALPKEVGDRMVGNGVNLISRFGSAECGFIMSSHRDYTDDKEWQYLRSDGGLEFLKFESQERGLHELVVGKGWPHMAKTNREDGSYATADLFESHKSLSNAWRYDSRADSQLTLITGKKFDPAPLEGAISTSELLDDALIFGNGSPFPGVLLFRSESAKQTSDAELIDLLWPLVEKLNTGSQDHARIPRKMLITMPVLDTPLEKSSKGTVIRGATEARFVTAIQDAYTNMSGVSIGGDVPDDEIPKVLKEMIQSIVPKKVDLAMDTDLFSYGVDSVAGIQLRHGIRQLLPETVKQLPLSIVEDCGTVARLADYIVKQRHGQELDDEEDEHQLMLRLVDQYSNFKTRPTGSPVNGEDGHANSWTKHHNNQNDDDGRDVIVLTGATGALGAHILSLYRDSDTVSKIYCLVRGTDDQSPRERVSKALEERGLRKLSAVDAKVEVLQASLSDHQLGLSERDYDRLANEVSIVMHVAWSVNFRMRLRSFVDDNISSVTNLINLALSSPKSDPARFAFCSSVASVMAYNGSRPTIPESTIDDPAASTSLGYSRSKWVAEQICARAGEETPLRGLIAVFRVGQLAGDSDQGIWNTKEAWPLMLSSVKLTRTLPVLKEETLDWLPVDIAAMALVEGVAGVSGSGEGVNVLHVLNENGVPKWPDLLGWLKKQRAFDTLNPREWIERLEVAQERDGADHPAFKLLDLWKKAYVDEHKSSEEGQVETVPGTKRFDLVKTRRLMPSMRDVKPVDEEYFVKLWHWIDAHM